MYVFWISVTLVAYIYVGYPVIAWTLAKMAGRSTASLPVEPRVTVLIAAHNEAAHIAETVGNKLTQDYPEALLDVIVISDGSGDGTDEIVQRLGPRVKLIRQETRAGKTAALNLAVGHAAGEILVFSDANSMYAPGAIRSLVANFADPTVGYVTGKMVYVNSDGSLVGDGCSAYMKYENWLRQQESRLASVIGVDGGIDAVRKTLYRPMRADQLPDFVLPLTVADQGYRVVYEPEALLHEAALSRQDEEYRMRVRVSLRALWALWDMRRLMNPLRHGLLAFQLVSHKLLRYLSFVPLAGVLASSVILAPAGGVYRAALILQVAVLSLAATGWFRRNEANPTVIGFPYYFCLLNLAAAHAAVRFLRRERQATWAPRTG
jgi:cellulose synthase/poly-beta-1,6-N-acetylglucosamine synthase-like glycosyltransferase